MFLLITYVSLVLLAVASWWCKVNGHQWGFSLIIVGWTSIGITVTFWPGVTEALRLSLISAIESSQLKPAEDSVSMRAFRVPLSVATVIFAQLLLLTSFVVVFGVVSIQTWIPTLLADMAFWPFL